MESLSKIHANRKPIQNTRIWKAYPKYMQKESLSKIHAYGKLIQNTRL